MFQGFSEQTVKFMWDIRFNNNREWFTEHKQEYKQYFEQPMTELANEVYAQFNKEHAQHGLMLHVARIYKDARRLNGQGPYRDRLWFTIRQPAEEWTATPSFWFELSPELWSYGLGYYWARPETMAKHRARIDTNPARMTGLAETLAAQSEFTIEGNSYKKPKGTPGGLLNEWYNLRSFSITHEEKLSHSVLSAKLSERISEGFEFLFPYYEYFGTLDSDPPVKKA